MGRVNERDLKYDADGDKYVGRCASRLVIKIRRKKIKGAVPIRILASKNLTYQDKSPYIEDDIPPESHLIY